MKKYTMSEIYEEMISHGATKLCLHFTKVLGKNILFSYHFFNDEWNEVGYLIADEGLYELLGAVYFETPRVWGDYLLREAQSHEVDDWLEEFTRWKVIKNYQSFSKNNN